jgi:hypothetical protein
MIDTIEKIKLLKKLLEKSSSVTVERSDDPNFKVWYNLVERTFIKVLGKGSPEFTHFSDLLFFSQVTSLYNQENYTSADLRCFREDFGMLKSSIDQYIEELEEQQGNVSTTTVGNPERPIAKVFISHSSQDSRFVEEMIEMLELIGLDFSQIFCTSFEGYGIGLGENFLDSIKSELSSDSLVIFILSKSFYESPVCLCEMGATWVLAKEHIPVLIPPLDYSDVKGVIPLSQGFKINEPLKLNLFKEKIEKTFLIESTVSMSAWERKRDRILVRIEESLQSSAYNKRIN